MQKSPKIFSFVPEYSKKRTLFGAGDDKAGN